MTFTLSAAHIEELNRLVSACLDLEDVGFIVHTGDIPYAHGMNFHARELNQTTMGLPVYDCIGNYDLETGAYGEEMFETLFGRVFYSFEAGNTHFVVTPMLSGTHAPSYNVTQVYEWLVNDLANKGPDKQLVVFNHFNLTTGNDFDYGPGGAQRVGLNNHRLKAWIYGHQHANYKKRHGETGIISVQSAPPTMGGINHSTGNFLILRPHNGDSPTHGLLAVNNRAWDDFIRLIHAPCRPLPIQAEYERVGIMRIALALDMTPAIDAARLIHLRPVDGGHLRPRRPLPRRTGFHRGPAKAVGSGSHGKPAAAPRRHSSCPNTARRYWGAMRVFGQTVPSEGSHG